MAFYQEKAVAAFWDNHWKCDNLRARIVRCQTDGQSVPAFKKWLPSGSRILEGGCGRGQLVHAFKYQGYLSFGLDFAKETVFRVKKAVPELDLITGDVFAVPLKDNFIDGYVSKGVIEHFWHGYDQIFSEMSRVIKENGFLFIAFPYMSPLPPIM